MEIMQNIKKKVEAVIAGEGRNRFFSFGSFLLVVSVLYSGAVKLRETFYRKGILTAKKLPCIVISIGNITVGGTGKTPLTIYVAELLRQFGYKVVIVSRGYKGSAEKIGGIASNGRTIFMDAYTAGDEPFMMAERLKNIPVLVGKNRFAAGMSAIKNFNPDVIVLDDAFQHLQLERNINLVLLDQERPFGNTHLLPGGNLREPVSSLLRGDAFILTRSKKRSDNVEATSLSKLHNYAHGRQVFISFHVPYISKVVKKNKIIFQRAANSPSAYDAEFLHGRNVIAFSGLARNADFRETVENFKCHLAGFFEFPDHYFYTDKDVRAILQQAVDLSADFILTTEKDYVRLVNKISWPVDLVVIGIEIAFGKDNKSFNEFITKRLDQLKKRFEDG